MNRIACYYCPATGKGAGAPIKLCRVAGRQADILHGDAQLLGDNLGKRGIVTLSLGANPSRHTNAATGFNRHSCPFIRPNAGAFDIGDNADAHILALGAQPWLLFSQELVVANQFDRFVQGWFIVAAVIDQRGKILVDQFVVVWELLGRNKIAPPNFDAVDA